MTHQKILAWNTDTTKDFMHKNGALYVRDAELIIPALDRLTRILQIANIDTVNAQDWHNKYSPEISATPNFKTTYPPHGMENTPGAAFIAETEPYQPIILDWREAQRSASEYQALTSRSGTAKHYVLGKDHFDVFNEERGSPHADPLLKAINPDIVLVYGVASNVCVDAAVKGLRARGRNVAVVDDAIKELPAEQAQVPLEQVLAGWSALGVRHTTTAHIGEALIDRPGTPLYTADKTISNARNTHYAAAHPRHAEH